jgi:hypothetical protein
MILDLTEVLKKHHHAFSAIMNRVEKAKAEKEQNKEKETSVKGSKRKLRKKRESNHTNN